MPILWHLYRCTSVRCNLILEGSQSVKIAVLTITGVIKSKSVTGKLITSLIKVEKLWRATETDHYIRSIVTYMCVCVCVCVCVR